jgi:hypothetical protein
VRRIELGSGATVTTEVRERQPDGSYSLVTPTTLALVLTRPDGTTQTYSSPTAASTGSYYQVIPAAHLAAVGNYQATWTATGPGAGTSYTNLAVYDPAADRHQLYVSVEELREVLGISDTERDGLLLRAATAASRQVDRHCGRRFWMDETATARVINPRRREVCDADGAHLLVPDIGDDEGLVVETGSAAGGWTTLATGAYELEPTDALDQGQPVTQLLRLGGRWSGGAGYRARITVRWGWPSIPDVAVQATTIQAARLFKRKDSPEGVMGSAEWGAIRLSRVDPDVQGLLQTLVLPGFA